MLDYENILDFCEKFDISIEAFFFCYILCRDKEELEGLQLKEYRPKKKGKSVRPLSYIYRYSENVRKWDQADIERLIKMGYLREVLPKWELDHRREGNVARHYPDYLEVTEKFTEQVMATYRTFEVFWNAYPQTCPNFNGHGLPAIPLKVADKDEVEKLYKRRVQTRQEHERLMKALQWARDTGRITMNIKNYVGGEVWRAHLEEMETQDVGSRLI